ncbi:CLAVATA3/ESR (CLE)-related protein 40-like [Nicotiana tabacum]|uniref:CLAVATA3/ESR (CLE)-related protein 40-like n=2 Tax=Nicotiana TaxID=4085 RepID=A0AC58TNB8_TOBAC|nr:PREDICTED: CLAVATA3/ESR (CLE)-related protein 40 [Nicotiana sylvestris]
MAYLGAFTMSLFYVLMIFMAVSAPFVLGFPPFGQEVKGGFPDEKIQKEGKRSINNEVSEESARQIPTGPDPLHHNHLPKVP